MSAEQFERTECKASTPTCKYISDDNVDSNQIVEGKMHTTSSKYIFTFGFENEPNSSEHQVIKYVARRIGEQFLNFGTLLYPKLSHEF